MEKTPEQTILDLKTAIGLKNIIISNHVEIGKLKDDIISKLKETIKKKDEIILLTKNNREETVSSLKKINELQDELILKKEIIIEKLQSKFN
jgi:hypothetical protein